MDRLSIYVFKDSFKLILNLLNDNDVQYQMRENRSEMIQAASSGVIEVLTSAAMWGALATVIVTYIKSKSGRKIIITTKENEVIHAEGLTSKELENILDKAKSISAVDVKT